MKNVSKSLKLIIDSKNKNLKKKSSIKRSVLLPREKRRLMKIVNVFLKRHLEQILLLLELINLTMVQRKLMMSMVNKLIGQKKVSSLKARKMMDLLPNQILNLSLSLRIRKKEKVKTLNINGPLKGITSMRRVIDIINSKTAQKMRMIIITITNRNITIQRNTLMTASPSIEVRNQSIIKVKNTTKSIMRKSLIRNIITIITTRLILNSQKMLKQTLHLKRLIISISIFHLTVSILFIIQAYLIL